jgi:hypothetical protein
MRRLGKYLNRSKWIFYMPVIGILVIALFLFSPDIYLLIYKETIKIPPLSDLTYGDKINIMLTFAITMFAAVEGYSTYTQVMLEDRRNKMESAKDELEKAYAPLYTLLNRFHFGASEDGVLLDERDKTHLDQIMAAYPFMFPAEIYEIWHQKICKMKAGEGLSLSTFNPPYAIPKEFVERIAAEYDRRVSRYNEMFGESSDDNKKT